MAVDALALVVRYLHILSGILWVGGLAYAALVVVRAMRKTPPGASGLALLRLGPGGFRYLTYAGTATILFGIWLQYQIAGEVKYRDGAWNIALGASVFLAIAMLGVLGGMIMPAVRKLAEAGGAPGAATAKLSPETEGLQRRLAIGTLISLALGVIAVFLMVYAVQIGPGA